MQPGLREFIRSLAANYDLLTIDKPVDPLHVSALIAESKKALLLQHVRGYDMPIVGGVVRDANKVALALDCAPEAVARKLLEAVRKPIPPVLVKDSPVKDVIITGDDVDLTAIPQILQHEKDGGPYTGSAIQFARHKRWGLDAGMYRHMFRTKNLLNIDFNTPNDIRMFYSEAQAEGLPLEMAAAIGNHPIEMIAATSNAPTGVNEMGIAGALRGEPVEMIRCETIDVEVPANAEVVLECEVLPDGWVADEGRYGEFHNVSGDVKRNPLVRVKAITHRRDAIWHSLLMPWEVWGLCAPSLEAQALTILEAARLRPSAVRAPMGGCAFFELIASLNSAKPGEGKAAVLALLSIMGVKMVTVVDDDINIYDDEELRWAMALRVQADRDVVIATNVQAKHMDPTVKSWTLPRGELPTGAKMGIDATIPPGISRDLYERLKYFNSDSVRLADYLE